jgi:hypothetical protein
MEILKITIDLGAGHLEDLVMRENDSPSVLAQKFCIKHRLNQ